MNIPKRTPMTEAIDHRSMVALLMCRRGGQPNDIQRRFVEQVSQQFLDLFDLVYAAAFDAAEWETEVANGC